MTDGWLSSRLDRLTPRERRVLALSSRGETGQEVAEVLGLTTPVVAAARQSIRRKLAVPKGHDLGEFVRAHEIDIDAIELRVEPRRAGERRSRHVLRAAIHDLDAVGRRIAARATTLDRFAVLAEDEERPQILEEATIVDDVAAEVQDLVRRTVARARSNDAVSG